MTSTYFLSGELIARLQQVHRFVHSSNANAGVRFGINMHLYMVTWQGISLGQFYGYLEKIQVGESSSPEKMFTFKGHHINVAPEVVLTVFL